MEDFLKRIFTDISNKDKVDTDYEFGYGCPMCKVLGDNCTHRFNRKELEEAISNMRSQLTELSKDIKKSNMVADVPLSIEDFKKHFPKIELEYNESYLHEDPSEQKRGEYFGYINCLKDGKIILSKRMTCRKVYPSDKYPDGVCTESIKIWISEAEHQMMQNKQKKVA